MILTHLVMFKFFAGASVAGAVPDPPPGPADPQPEVSGSVGARRKLGIGPR